MKKAFRIIVPILLAIAIILGIGWYLFEYDRDFTRDMLLHAARHFEGESEHSTASWFYDLAYRQADDNDQVAIELAEQYKSIGNFTKAEYTLSNAIADGGGVELYIALSKTYVEQDKLLDAVSLLNGVTNPEIKETLDELRPPVPTASAEPGFYSQYISVTISAESGTLYTSTVSEFPSIEKDLNDGAITLVEGENTIYAIAVAENGLVSPRAVLGYTVGGVIEAVAFADEAMETAIRTKLAAGNHETVMNNRLWKFTEFTVPEEAKNLADLKHMIYLEELVINDGPVGQLSNISGLSTLKSLTVTETALTQEEIRIIGALPMLEKLTLSGCSIASIEGLSSAVKLTYLNVSDNTIRNIAPISKMTALRELNLSHNALVDVTALGGLTTLTRVDVSHNSLESITPLTFLSDLEVIKANTNKLTGTDGFDKLTKLMILDLGYNAITDVTGLGSCKGLEELDISNNTLTDISALGGLTGLTKLNFAYNQVTALPAFQKSCDLVVIDGSHNQISSLAPLGGLENLNDVYMDYNEELASVEALADCPLLILVNVYGTKVTEVEMLTKQSVIVNYNPVQED